MRQALRRTADGACQAQFRQIVGEHAVDVVEFRAGHRFLRLHDFHVVGDTGVEALPRQIQSFFGYLRILRGHFHLAARGFQVEIRVADVAFNPASKVLDLRSSLR